MRSIVRRDTGEASWLTKRIRGGVGHRHPAGRAELARFDRKRKKKGSNVRLDASARSVATRRSRKMKDGRTHLAHTAEHAVDLDDRGHRRRDGAGRGRRRAPRRSRRSSPPPNRSKRSCGRAWHRPRSSETRGITSQRDDGRVAAIGLRSYVSEPDRGRRTWKGKTEARCRRVRESIGGFGVPAGNDCCASAASCSNGPMRISTRPGGCAGCICGTIPTS